MKRHRANKYGAKRTTVNGRVFHSKGEAGRYKELLFLENAGQICCLEGQPKYPIVINGVKICTVIADFKYFDCAKTMEVTINGKKMPTASTADRWRIEDFKGHDTALSKIKRKLVKACHGIDVEVVKKS